MKTRCADVTEPREGGRDWTVKAWWVLEGSHGMARDADMAVALLEVKLNDGDAEAMRLLCMC